MRYFILLCGFLILALGCAAMSSLGKTDGQGFFYGALQLGGGLVICGGFSFQMPWHGIIGAGIVAMLGFARGLVNVPKFFAFLAGDRTHGTGPLFELGATIICLVLVARVIRLLQRERVRRMLEEE